MCDTDPSFPRPYDLNRLRRPGTPFDHMSGPCFPQPLSALDQPSELHRAIVRLATFVIALAFILLGLRLGFSLQEVIEAEVAAAVLAIALAAGKMPSLSKIPFRVRAV